MPRHLALPPPMDLPMLDPDLLEDLGFLDGPIDMEPAKEAAPAAASGAGLGLLYALAVANIKVAKRDEKGQVIPDPENAGEVVKVQWADTAFKRVLVGAGLSVAGALALGYKGQESTISQGRVHAIHGLAGGLGAIVTMEIYAAMMKKKAAEKAEAAGGQEGLFGLGADADEVYLDSALPEERELLADVDVEERRPVFSEVDVTERRPGQIADVGSWIG